VVPKVCSAGRLGSAHIFHGIHGCISVMATLSLTYFVNSGSNVKNNRETSLIGGRFVSNDQLRNPMYPQSERQ
jgi:hypothetical protein